MQLASAVMSTARFVDAREKKTPIWAMLAPIIYLLACGLAARALFAVHDDAGVPGLLAAVGLLPAFVIPVVFTTTRVSVAAVDGGLAIAGLFGTDVAKVDDARVQHGEGGTALLHVVTRAGETRTFILRSQAEARVLVARLPSASAPAGALMA